MNVKSAVLALIPPFFRKYTDRIETSPLGYRLAKGAFWSLVGALTSRGLVVLSSIFVARMLGKTGFGELGIIQSTIGMFGVFAGFGLGLTSTKYIAEFRVKNPDKAGRIMALSSLVAALSGGVMAVLLLVHAPWLATHALAAPQLSSLLQVDKSIVCDIPILSRFAGFMILAGINCLAAYSGSFILADIIAIASIYQLWKFGSAFQSIFGPRIKRD